MDRLLDTLRALRAPDGCPWDRQQTHDSLRPYLLEEAAEAVDALASGHDPSTVEELGDVLLQVAFHAVIAEEEGRYAYRDIEAAISEKLVRRHPHVFGDEEASDAAAVEVTWARVKETERTHRGAAEAPPAEGVPRSLPALARTAALGRALGWRARAGGGGAALRAVGAAAGEAGAGAAPVETDTLGDALLALALLVREAGHDPELLLRDRLAARLAEGT